MTDDELDDIRERWLIGDDASCTCNDCCTRRVLARCVGEIDQLTSDLAVAVHEATTARAANQRLTANLASAEQKAEDYHAEILAAHAERDAYRTERDAYRAAAEAHGRAHQATRLHAATLPSSCGLWCACATTTNNRSDGRTNA